MSMVSEDHGSRHERDHNPQVLRHGRSAFANTCPHATRPLLTLAGSRPLPRNRRVRRVLVRPDLLEMVRSLRTLLDPQIHSPPVQVALRNRFTRAVLETRVHLLPRSRRIGFVEAEEAKTFWW